MAKEEFSYSKKAAELEKIIAALQNPDILIDEATKLHATGLELVEQIESYLEQADILVKKHVADS